jgi:hypothetical protein
VSPYREGWKRPPEGKRKRRERNWLLLTTLSSLPLTLLVGPILAAEGMPFLFGWGFGWTVQLLLASHLLRREK